jgi:hypothetical protein
MSHIIHFESSCYEEATRHPIWRDLVMEEYQSIMKNYVWDVFLRHQGNYVVISKWIYNIKHTVDGRIKRHKMRFVARVFSQVEGIDYEETFFPIGRYTSIQMIISPTTSMGWRVHQMDVNTTFLNGEIEEEVYNEQPYGFVIHEKESHVCRLKKALYGLKQPPRGWYVRIDGHLMIFGFNKSVVDPNRYYKTVNCESLILVLCIDDLFLTSTESLIVECKYALASKFEMKDLGMMHYFLGLEMWQTIDEIFLSQGKYTVEILKKFGILNLKPVATPIVTNMKKLSVSSSDSRKIYLTLYRQLIGSLMYLVNTRPNICYAISTLSQFISQQRQTH